MHGRQRLRDGDLVRVGDTLIAFRAVREPAQPASADTVPAGMTRIRLRNDGPDIHHVHLVRIDSGHTTAELFARLSAGDLDIPWMTLVGGPEIPAMGTESVVTLDLPAGQYAMFCVVPSLDGVRHVAKGMFRALTVTPSATPVAAVEPKADVRMVLSDYAFTLTPELTRGVHTVRVENEAEQPHMVVLIRLHAGKTAVDAEQWSKHRQGPPPFDEAGGTTAIARGKAVFYTTDVTPADYLLLCFWPDAKDGRSHAAHGMVRQITIR